MSTLSVSLNDGIVLRSVKDVQGALKDGKITQDEAKRYTAMFQGTEPDLEKGTTVQSANDQPLTPQQQAQRNAARASQQAEIDAAKAQSKEETPKRTINTDGTYQDEYKDGTVIKYDQNHNEIERRTLLVPPPATKIEGTTTSPAPEEQKKVTTETTDAGVISITSYKGKTDKGEFTIYTSNLRAPEKKMEKHSKDEERAQLARYYDEDTGKWIEMGDQYKTRKELNRALRQKQKEIKREYKAARKANKKESKQLNKDFAKTQTEYGKVDRELSAAAKAANLSREEILKDSRYTDLAARYNNVKAEKDRIQDRLDKLNDAESDSREELAQVKQARIASRRTNFLRKSGVGADTRAYNANVKANNRLVDRVVVMDKSDAKQLKHDPQYKDKDIKVVSQDDLRVLNTLRATARDKISKSSSPEETALWEELANLDPSDTKQVQDALIDLTGGDMRLNYTEQEIISKETGLSKSDIRHAFKTYGFEAPNPTGKRIVNGLKLAAPQAAIMGMSYLLTKSKAHAESTSSAEASSDAHAESTVTQKVVDEKTAHAIAEVEGFKYSYIDPETGEEVVKRIAGKTAEDVQTAIAEAIATATAKADAHASVSVVATAIAEAVAKLSPAALVAGPLLAGLAGYLKTPTENSATINGVNTQKMASYVEVFKKNKNKNIGNQIVQMQGQITGDEAVDRALIVSVLDHEIGSQNTVPTTRELRAALDHLQKIQEEIKKKPPEPKPTPPEPKPTPPGPKPTPPGPTECPVDLTTENRQYVHKRRAGDTWAGLVEAYYPDCIGLHSMSDCIRELKKQLAYDEDGTFNEARYKDLLRGTDIPKTLLMPDKIFDCDIHKDAKVKARKFRKGGRSRLDRAGHKYTDYYKQDCHDNEPVRVSKDEWTKLKEKKK